MNVSFRAATRDDVPAVLALLRDDDHGVRRETGDLATYLDAFDTMQAEGTNTLMIGETADGRIVATYQLTFITGLSHRATRRAQIESVRVASDLRGQGIGRQMMADAETRARAAGCRLLQLTTQSVRNRARDFYDSLGYTPSHIGFKKPLDDTP